MEARFQFKLETCSQYERQNKELSMNLCREIWSENLAWSFQLTWWNFENNAHGCRVSITPNWPNQVDFLVSKSSYTLEMKTTNLEGEVEILLEKGPLYKTSQHYDHILYTPGKKVPDHHYDDYGTGVDVNIVIFVKLRETAGYAGSGIKSLYNNKDSSDIEIQCGNVSIHAHKSILAAHSDTLRTAFQNEGFVEAKTGVYKIEEEHMKPNILKDVIKWMYLFKIPYPSGKVNDLLEAAEYFQMANLKKMCSHLLMLTLGKENCLKYLNTSYKYKFKELQWRSCEAFIENKMWVLRVDNQNLITDDDIKDVPVEVREALGLEQRGLICASLP